MPEKESGSLSAGGAVLPPRHERLLQLGAGTHVGCISGPAGTDFDLYLEKWNGSTWVVVAQGITSTSEEKITYTGTAGYYSWRVESYSGLGQLHLRPRPAVRVS